MKVLMVSNKVRSYALGFQNSINPLKSLDHEIVWAADFSHFNGDISEIPCKTYQISINTSPLKPCNCRALLQLLKIIKEEKIEAVVCSTPIGGLLARIAAKIKHVEPVIYTAHGFLFFKGAPLINRTVYKWEEMILAHWTDALITITQEDYEAAQSFKLRNGTKPYLVHGAGVKTGVKVEKSREEKRKELGIPDNAFVIVSVGELNKNKNNIVMIDAVGLMNNKNVYYIICGDGAEKENLANRAKELSLENRVLLLGYRNDVAEILSCSDVFVMPSLREGLPRAIMEAMDMGLPCVCSKIRGAVDLIGNNEGGFLCLPTDAQHFSKCIETLKVDTILRKTFGERNKRVVGDYSAEKVTKELYQIYSVVMA